MPFSGNVETIPLDEVFSFIADNALEGSLTIAGGGAKITLYFIQGQVFFPYSARRGTYSLGKILRATGVLSREALERQLQQVRDNRAAELRELEAKASPEQVEAARRKQYEEEIHDVFLWRRAYFEFTPSSPPEEVQKQRVQGKGVTLDPTGFLMDVARRSDERRRIRRAIPSGRVVLEVVPGANDAVAAGLKKRRIIAEGDDTGIDGKTSLEELLEVWGIPHHDALSGLAPLVEAKQVRPMTLEGARAGFETALKASDAHAAARLASHLVELGTPPPGVLSLGPEAELIASQTFARGGDAVFSARLHGLRAYALARALIQRRATFTLRTFQDGRERNLAFSPDRVAFRASHDETTASVGRYLRRSGVLSEPAYKLATSTSEKESRSLTDVLLRAGTVTHDDCVRAGLEKIGDELASVALSPEVDVELVNRVRDAGAQGPGAPKPDSAYAIALTVPLDEPLCRRFGEHIERWHAVFLEVPGEDAVFLPGPRAGDPDPAAKFFGRFDGKRSTGILRRVAKAEALEFLKFVQNGVKRGYIRAPQKKELEETFTEAVERGDDARAFRLSCSAVAFGISEPFYARAKELRAKDAAPSLDPRPSIEGDMEGIGLAAVLQGLRGGKRTGTLTITDGKRDSKIYFHRGAIFLLRLADKEAQEFVDFFLDGGDEAGQIAAAIGAFVDESTLDADEARKLKDDVLDVLFWDKARFTFRKNELPEDFHTPPEGASKVALDTDKFLMEAIRRIEAWDQIKRVIPGGEVVLAFATPEQKMAAIREGENTEVLTLVDGRHSFDDVVRISGVARLEVGRLLKGLLEREELVIVGQTTAA